jgi:signal peptidase I
MDVAPRDAAGEPVVDAPAHPPAVGDGAQRSRRSWRTELPVLVLVAGLVTLLLRAFVVQAFYIPSGSMEPTLAVGDRVLVSRVAYRVGDVHRGDVIVFDGRDSFGALPTTPAPGLLGRLGRDLGTFLGFAPSETDYVKRVVGLPGDRVVCCDSSGRLSVNGSPVDEPYLFPGDTASASPFDVQVPSGRLWVMGDHRSDSADSRSHLGDPGGGTVPLERVVGTVWVRFWPLDRFGSLGRTS